MKLQEVDMEEVVKWVAIRAAALLWFVIAAAFLIYVPDKIEAILSLLGITAFAILIWCGLWWMVNG